MKAAIDRVVSSLREMKRAREASCLREYTPTKRDLAKNHSWTWLRTIWLTGPFALTVALREYVQREPSSSTLMGTFDAHATGCLSSKRVNAAMASERRGGVWALLRAARRVVRRRVAARGAVARSLAAGSC